MTSPEILDGAIDWSTYLSDKQLPATPQVGRHILALMKQGDLPYKTLATIINGDPVLSFYVLAAANSGNSQNNRSSSLEHAISMIGLTNLRQLISKASYFKPDATNIRHFYYLRSQNTSLYAAYLLKAISEHKQTANSENAYWASLFYGVPWWLLWRFATPEMRLIRYAIRTNGKSQDQAEREVLGCTAREIGIELAKELALPQLVLDSYKPENTPDSRAVIALGKSAKLGMMPDLIEDKTLRHMMQTPSFGIILCNTLAHASTHDWYSSLTLRCQKVLAAYLNWPLEKAIKLTHTVAAAMSRAHSTEGVMAPASKIMLPPREYVKVNSFEDSTVNKLMKSAGKQALKTLSATQASPDKPAPTREQPSTPAPTKPVVTAKAAPKATPKLQQETETPDSNRKLNYTLFKQLATSLVDTPDEFADLHEIMNAAVQGISYGLGLSRATVALANTKLTRLKAYYTVGTRQFPELGNFQIDLTKPSLFSRLTEKQSSIWIKPDTQRSTWNLIPVDFKRVSGVNEFFLMSVFVNQKPVAVFYADGGPDAPPATEWEYKQFKHMCTAVTKCLNHQATHKTAPEQ